MDELASRLPRGKGLDDLLDLRLGGGIEDLVTVSLLDPVKGFLSRPAKNFRASFVELGFRLSGEKSQRLLSPEDEGLCRIGADVIETLHAGSLVVDDIEDESRERRGAPSLHLEHGIPVALNAGNWLYFWPFERIRSAGLDAERELALYRVCHQVLLRAHFGQALDVGVSIDTLPRERVLPVCLASLELKTGALMELAVAIGAVFGGVSPARRTMLSTFGRSFGVALQMFDDIGNLIGRGEGDPKRHEDLRLKRPSWVWAVAASELDAEALVKFRSHVEALPKEEALAEWLSAHSFVPRAKVSAKRYLDEAVATLASSLASEGDFDATLSIIRDLGERLSKAYD